MSMEFERVLDGIAKYININVYSGMSDWQELLARVAVGRVFANSDTVKTALINNGIVRTFGIINADGMVDVDGLIADIKKVVTEKGKIEVSIPMFGKMIFKTEDVDMLYLAITENGGGS